MRAVITGGAGDLASELSSHLSAHGFEVHAPGRSQLDVTLADELEEYFSQRDTDLLICNAGITRDRPLALLTVNDWDEVIAVNLRGAIRCTRAALASMKQKGGGHVIVISSYSALHPPIGQAAYATAKAGLLGFVKDFARQHGGDNIRFNAILPGLLDTKMTGKLSEARKQQLRDEHTLGRINTCTQVAAFIRFLHQEMPHTSGQVFQLDSRTPL